MQIKLVFDEQASLTWAVKVVEPGDFFGVDDRDINDSEHHIVEFYDTSHRVSDLGWFVSCQRLDTLLEDYSKNLPDMGHMIGGISAQALSSIANWLQSKYLVPA